MVHSQLGWLKLARAVRDGQRPDRVRAHADEQLHAVVPPRHARERAEVVEGETERLLELTAHLVPQAAQGRAPSGPRLERGRQRLGDELAAGCRFQALYDALGDELLIPLRARIDRGHPADHGARGRDVELDGPRRARDAGRRGPVEGDVERFHRVEERRRQHVHLLGRTEALDEPEHVHRPLEAARALAPLPVQPRPLERGEQRELRVDAAHVALRVALRELRPLVQPVVVDGPQERCDGKTRLRVGMLRGEQHVGAPVGTAVLERGPEGGVEVVHGARAGAGGEAHAGFEEPQSELPVLAARREALVVRVLEQVSRAREAFALAKSENVQRWPCSPRRR